jgi:hypothetical protein
MSAQQIKFRGRKADGEWVYGSLVRTGDNWFIVPYHQTMGICLNVNKNIWKTKKSQSTNFLPIMVG